MRQNERYTKVLEYFINNVGPATTELHYNTNFHLLIAVILSAQCTDKRVNIVTLELFKHFYTEKEMSRASFSEIFELIKSVSFPNSKTKYLIETSIRLVENYDCQIPKSIEDLTSLPGVGRKTANVIRSVCYDIPSMPVDTHVFRVSNRIGLTNSKNVLDTEKVLVKHIPKEHLNNAHHWLILHGRYICVARKPKCEKCGLTSYCKFWKDNN